MVLVGRSAMECVWWFYNSEACFILILFYLLSRSMAMDVEMGHARFAFAFLSSRLGQSQRWNLTCRRGMLAHLSKFSADVIRLSLFVASIFCDGLSLLYLELPVIALPLLISV